MTHDPQEILNRLSKNKARAKEISTLLREAYEQNQEYVERQDKRKAITERIKQIKQTINEGYGKEVTELEDLKIDIAGDRAMLTDMLLSAYTKGEEVQLETEFGQQCLPIFSVRIAKVK